MTVILKHSKISVSVYDLPETANGTPKPSIEFAGMKYTLTGWDKKNKKAIYKEVEGQ